MVKLDFIDKTLEIKDPPDFTVVSTFSGGGGSSTGYVWAGGKVLLAVEWDDNAVETYKLNYPNTDVYHGDIANLPVDEVLERTGLQVGELDIFDGSPPCQGFSTAGKRVMDDPRNQLFREYTRLLKGLQPKVFVMENVSGMVKGKMKLLFAEILTELKSCGYQVNAKLLNAMYLGVPQSRQRMIFIGVRDDLGIQPSHPKPQTNVITVGDAIKSFPKNPKTDRVFPEWLKDACTLVKMGSNIFDAFKETKGTTGGAMSTKLLKYNKPSNTIAKSEISVTGLIHPDGDRYLSIDELKAIGGYPDIYQFIGKRSDKVARIGNSVPPRMMQYIAEHIKDEILSKIKEPAK